METVKEETQNIRGLTEEESENNVTAMEEESNEKQTKGKELGENEEWTGPRLNLAQLAQNHLAFLKTIHNIPNLHKPDYIRNAIRRYEYMWLQIASKYDKVEMEPPIDIHWIWHIHMLAPRQYGVDCQNVSGTVVNHKFRITKNDINTARANCIEIWRRWFPDEPYDVDFNVPLSEKDLAHKPTMIRYDILSAAARQRSFYYHVSLPHFTDAKFLNTAADRYVQFLKLKKDHPEAFIVPMYDVDLIWHTHQLHPHAYAWDMMELLGYLLHHNDKDTDRSRHSRLTAAESSTRLLWRDSYGENFQLPGTMYRGEPPLGKLHKGEYREFSVGRPMTCKLDIKSITLVGGKQGFVVDCRLTETSRGIQGEPIRFQTVKGLPHVWKRDKATDDDVKPIQLKTKVETLLSFHFTRRDGIRSFMAKNLCRADKYIRDLSLEPSVQPVMMEASDETGYQVKIEGNLFNIEPGEQTLELDFGSFADYKMPETLEHLWGPVNIAKLPPGVYNSCRMASHTVYVRMQAVYTIRIIHSLELRMSVVQVFYKGKMVALSQLVDNDHLPKPSQVGLKRECVTYDVRTGERAMIVKNADGDWGIIKGEWIGFRKAKNLQDEITCEPGNPGYFSAVLTDLVNSRKASVNLLKTPRNPSTVSKNKAVTFQLFSNTEGVKVNSGDGTMKLGKYCKDIPELVAASFSIGILALMCEPRPQIFLNQGLPAYPKDPSQIPGLKTYENLLMYNCGYLEPMYSNSWIYWYHMLQLYKHKDAPALPVIAPVAAEYDKDKEEDQEQEQEKANEEQEIIEKKAEEEPEEEGIKEMEFGGRKLRRRWSSRSSKKGRILAEVYCPWDPDGTGNHGAEVAIASSINAGEYYSYAIEAAMCGACSTSVSHGFYDGRDCAGFSSDSGVGSGSTSDGATSGGYGSGDNSSFGGGY